MIYFYITNKMIVSWTQFEEELELFCKNGGAYLMTVSLDGTLEQCQSDLDNQRDDLQTVADVVLSLLDQQRKDLEAARMINVLSNTTTKDSN